MAGIGNVTLEEVLEQIGVRPDRWEARAEARGEARGEARRSLEMAIAMVNDGDSVERAARITGIPVEQLEQYL